MDGMQKYEKQSIQAKTKQKNTRKLAWEKNNQ